MLALPAPRPLWTPPRLGEAAGNLADRLRRWKRQLFAPTRVEAQGRFVQAGGRVVAAGGQKAGDDANCDQCPCTSAGCAKCAGSTPPHYRVTFAGMSVNGVCTCFQDGLGNSYTFTGDLNGASFCLDYLGANGCAYGYTGPSPISWTKYGNGSCALDPVETGNEIQIALDLTSGEMRANTVDSSTLLSAWFLGTFTFDDCTSSEIATNRNDDAEQALNCGVFGTLCTTTLCYTWDGTATATPASTC